MTEHYWCSLVLFMFIGIANAVIAAVVLVGAVHEHKRWRCPHCSKRVLKYKDLECLSCGGCILWK